MVRYRLISGLLWFLFLAWLFVQVLFFTNLDETGKAPVDYYSYQIAARALERAESPYLPPEQSRERFRKINQIEVELLAARARNEGRVFIEELAQRPVQPGPYIYPPTLAYLIGKLNIDSLIFGGLLLLSVLGFVSLWFAATKAHGGWLLLVIGSRDVLATLQGGNVELLLLFAAILAAKSIWDRRFIPAVPLIGFVLLIKPFYGLFFIAFLLLQTRNPQSGVRNTSTTIILPGAILLLILVAEIVRWGPELRTETLRFFLHASDHLWMALPVPEQSPLSAWNRTPLQGLINLGVPVTTAQVIALLLWCVLLGITLWQARKAALSFPLVFALALTLLYWGRPAGYGFNYLELVVAAVVWPSLRNWEKPVFLCLITAAMASRWWAFLETLRGESMALLTMQTPGFHWETWFVLPLSWLLLMRAMTQDRKAPNFRAASNDRSSPS